MRDGAIFFLFSIAILSSSYSAQAQEDEFELGDLGFYLHQLYDRDDMQKFRDAVLDLNYNVDQPNEFGQSVLQCASRDGKTNWIDMLLSLGAGINLPDPNRGWPPIGWALAAGHCEAYKHLQGYGAFFVHPISLAYGW